MLLADYGVCSRMFSRALRGMALAGKFHNESNKCIMPFKVIFGFCQDFLPK